MFKNRSIIYFTLVALAAMAGGYMVSRQLAHPVLQLDSGTLLPAPRPLAAFSLTDHQGAAFTSEQLRGRPHLVFFGFTHCPDVCPTTLALLAQLQRESPPAGAATLFITVDPERDDQNAMRRYVEAFGGQMTGLRGDDAALEPLLQSLGAARSVHRTPDGGYVVDHTATLYYLDAGGRLAAVFTPPFELSRLRADLARLASAG